ncbi:hypothetical protein PUN28_015689 [Cardiocondyla obscurior]|uniref:Uncharacterized protein n=1 Tax=Cardiocondyla obscurior TaxID=286306 RepID=A0AAW2EW13_9HYME
MREKTKFCKAFNVGRASLPFLLSFATFQRGGRGVRRHGGGSSRATRGCAFRYTYYNTHDTKFK